MRSMSLKISTDPAPLISDEDRREIKAAYKVLYRSGLDLPVALKRMDAEFTSDAVRHWIEFFRTPSKRGFCRYSTGARRQEPGE